MTDHAVIHNAYTAKYWHNGTACSFDDPRCNLVTLTAGKSVNPELNFRFPDQRQTFEDVCRAMTHAHAAGYKAAKKAIRDVIMDGA